MVKSRQSGKYPNWPGDNSCFALAAGGRLLAVEENKADTGMQMLGRALSTSPVNLHLHTRVSEC